MIRNATATPAKRRSLLEVLGVNHGKVVAYSLPETTTIEEVVREIIAQSGINEIYLVPQSRYERGKTKCLEIPSIYEIPASPAEIVGNKSFDEIRVELGYDVLNFAAMARRGNLEQWIPLVDLLPSAKKVSLKILAEELVCNIGLGDGFLVDSGEGLHFWGLHTTTQETWKRIWEQMLRKAYSQKKSGGLWLDNEWLAQNISRYSIGPYALRVTNWPAKNKPAPKPLYYLRNR